jgi:predicted dehydrogenase
MDIGCYPVTLARWLFAAEPLDVLGLIERDPRLGIDRLTSGLLRFAAGRASFNVSTQLVPHQRFEAFGTRGRIELQIPFNAPPDRPVRLLVDEGTQLGGAAAEVMELAVVDQYTIQGDVFSAAIRGHGSVPVTLEDAIANMAVIDALFRSAATGHWEAPHDN